MGNTSFKNILLVGATGNLGKPILQALLADKSFQVTVLSRADSSATFPSGVKVKKVDYSDHGALVNALRGEEVVISAVGGAALAKNFDSSLIKAALAAGVKWFIPSEFGIDTSHPVAASNPVLASKVATGKLLQENESRLAYTFIDTGLFLDWGLDNGFLGFDLSKHSATLYNAGQNAISGTTLPHIGQAVVAILHHFSQAKNKRLFIADATFTQQQALTLLEKHTGSEWTKKQMSSADLVKQSGESFAKGEMMNGVISSLLSVVYDGQGASDFQGKTSNKSLGVAITPLEEIIKEAVGRSKHRK